MGKDLSCILFQRLQDGEQPASLDFWVPILGLFKVWERAGLSLVNTGYILIMPVRQYVVSDILSLNNSKFARCQNSDLRET